MSLAESPSHATLLPGNWSWVKPYLETPMVQLISAFAPPFPPPSTTESLEQWHQDLFRFEEICAGGAFILVAFGFAVALMLCLRSCGVCCQCQPQRVPTRKPSPKALYCTSCMTIFFSVAGVLTYLVWGLQGLESVHRHLGGLTNDLHLVTQQGVQLSELGSQAWGVMNETMPNCNKSAQERLTIAERSVAALLDEVDMYNMNITHVSKRLDAVQASLGRVPPKYLYSLALPLALVIAGCLMVILPVRWSSVAGEKCGRGCGKCCASCGSCCLRFSSVLFAPAIFLVATAAGLEYGIGLAAGSFCEGVDSNVLAYVESFEGEVAFNASRYYIEGNGSNPLLEKLQQANASLSDVSKQVEIHSRHIQEGCGGNATDVVDILLRSFAAMERPIDETAELLSAHHMYPYYSKMAHEKLCGSIIGGLAWLVMLQYIVGILCLPLLTCAADSLLQRQRLFWEHDASRRLVEGCGAEDAYPYEQQQQQHFGRPQQQQHFGRGDDVA